MFLSKTRVKLKSFTSRLKPLRNEIYNTKISLYAYIPYYSILTRSCYTSFYLVELSGELFSFSVISPFRKPPEKSLLY